MILVFSTVGMTFSVLATQAGMPAWGILLMSFVVYAGAVIAGGSAIAFNLAGFGNWTTLTATVVTVAVVRSGVIWIKARSSQPS